MALAKFWHKGERIDYVNGTGSKISANTIMPYGSRIAIAGGDIPNGEKGALYVEGVFEMPKYDSTAINAGVDVYWDDTNGGITTTSTDNTKAGFAAAAALAADETILVKINA